MAVSVNREVRVRCGAELCRLIIRQEKCANMSLNWLIPEHPKPVRIGYKLRIKSGQQRWEEIRLPLYHEEGHVYLFGRANSADVFILSILPTFLVNHARWHYDLRRNLNVWWILLLLVNQGYDTCRSSAKAVLPASSLIDSWVVELGLEIMSVCQTGWCWTKSWHLSLATYLAPNKGFSHSSLA